MSGSELSPAATSEFIGYLERAVAPRTVLEIGTGLHEIGEGLRDRGSVLDRTQSASEPIAQKYDLVLLSGVGSLHPSYGLPALLNLSGSTNAVVFGDALSGGVPNIWYEALLALGFNPETDSRSTELPTPPILLRRQLGPGDSFAELIRLRQEITSLRSALADLRDEAKNTRERLESRILQLQSKLSQNTHDLQSILKSRTWRTLVACAGWFLKAAGLLRIGASADRVREHTAPDTDAASRVVCDEPAGDMPRTGIVKFRGWAISPHGISRVEVQPFGGEPVPARIGLYRPDVSLQFADIADADRCGFQASLDTTPLPNGKCEVTVRAISKNGGRREIKVPLLLDHAYGYASEYHRWISEFEKRDLSLIERGLQSFALRPVISLLVPVYRTAPAILERTIGSVLAQSYPNWELCIADDGSQSPEIDQLLSRYESADARIKTTRLPRNSGIAQASNEALNLAKGEYVALLDHDDELAIDALYHVVAAINREPDADILYSDEDHIDESGFRSDPFFKPQWSPDLILSENYVNHLMVFKASLARSVGGFRSECDLSQDHDILLRMSLKARRIVHIPRILYHWRTNVFTIDRASSQENRALASSRRVIEDYLRLARIRGTVEPGAVSGRWRVKYGVRENALVDIIIPCGGKTELLERCLNSVASMTDYPHYRLTVVDNSVGDRVERFVRAWSKGGHSASYVDWRERPFNFSAMNNEAARRCDGRLLLFLNDDVTVINREWLTAMAELASRTEVGPVGAKLLFPDGRIQHAGLVVGIFGVCGHAFKGFFSDERSYFDFPDVIRNVSAVTGACMMVRSELFWEAGGFDQENFPVAYNDVDFCLKLLDKGYRVLYTPHARLYHHEGFSKRPEDKAPREPETKAFQARWSCYIAADPFYSPNLTRLAEDYAFRKLQEA